MRFPIIKNIHYLDNAATTQKPTMVVDALKDFYLKHNANTHRGIYRLSEQATVMLEDSRKVFAQFINALPEEIIFVRNATEGFNNIAVSIERSIDIENKNIIITEIEHHSNLIPWQQLCRRKKAVLRISRYDVATDSIGDLSALVDDDTIIAAFTAMSNVNGLKPDVKNIIKNIRSKNNNTIIVIDATQYAAHDMIDVKGWDADFVVFSAHKVYGTAGVGVVYGRKDMLLKLEPAVYGGNMISDVSLEQSLWADIPEKFEAGTIDAAGIIASAQAIKYFKENMMKFLDKEKRLQKYTLKRLRTIQGLNIIGHKTKNDLGYGPVISFTIEDIHPHDLATICDEHDVCIRAGHHCAQPFMKALVVNATSRVSLSFYNTKKDIDALIDAINDAIKVLR